MSTLSGPARAGQFLRRSAFGVTLAGVVAAGAALPAAAASAATPAPAPAPAPAQVSASSPSTAAPGALPTLATPVPSQDRTRQPHGGVDTGAGGSQSEARSGTDAAVPLAAGGAGLGALAVLGLWRRRRAGALG